MSRATEILCERWTLLLVRNLLLGVRTFNEIAGGVPGMSRSLLSDRLRFLEQRGIVRSQAKLGRRGSEYELTEAGRGLAEVVGPLAAWGARWIERQPEHADPSFVLWAWVHVHLKREQLPKRRVVVAFEFPDQPASYSRFWLLIDRGQAELCSSHPKFQIDLKVRARSQAFTRWHVGEIEWPEALAAGEIQVVGPRPLARSLPTWNGRALNDQSGK